MKLDDLVYLSKLIKTKIMKTKNDLKTGILIGLGMIVIPLIMMGTSYTTEKQNKFEVHMSNYDGFYTHGVLLNTETGETWYLNDEEKYKHELRDLKKEESTKKKK